MGSQDGMMIIACLGLRVGVHQRGRQPRRRVQQVVLGVDRDPVRLDRAGTGIDDDLAFSAQTVPDPAQPLLDGLPMTTGQKTVTFAAFLEADPRLSSAEHIELVVSVSWYGRVPGEFRDRR
jgi:hypothetical protein